MRRAIISSAWCWPMTRWSSVSARLQHRLDLVLHHAADRDAGPVRDHRGHGLLVDASAGSAATRPAASRSCACSSCSSASSAVALGRRRLPASPAATAGLGRRASAAVSSVLPVPSTGRLAVAQRRAQRQDAVDQLLLRLPSAASSSASALALAAQLRSAASAPLGGVDADRLFAADDLQLGLAAPRCCAAAVLDLGRHGVLADRRRARRRCRAG